MAATKARFRLRPPRRLTVMREGWFYLPLTLGVGFGAINTGNNMLYLLLGLQLSTIILSGVLSEIVLRGLEVHSVSTRDGRAGEEAVWRIDLSKTSGWLPSFSLVVTSLDGPARGASRAVLRLPVGGTEQVELRYHPERRGHFTAQQLEISTRFPFGLFQKSRVMEVDQEIFVFPRRSEGTPPPPQLSRREGSSSFNVAGHGAELLHLRPHTSGDDLRRLHWRKSAQLGSWVVTVREREIEEELTLDLDLHAQAFPSDLARLEQRIEQTAADAEVALDKGFNVGLRCGRDRLAPGSGTEQRVRILRTLASAQPILEGEAA